MIKQLSQAHPNSICFICWYCEIPYSKQHDTLQNRKNFFCHQTKSFLNETIISRSSGRKEYDYEWIIEYIQPITITRSTLAIKWFITACYSIKSLTPTWLATSHDTADTAVTSGRARPAARCYSQAAPGLRLPANIQDVGEHLETHYYIIIHN